MTICPENEHFIQILEKAVVAPIGNGWTFNLFGKLKNHVKYRNSLFTDIKAIVFFIVKVPEPKIAENYQINLIQNHNI